MWFRLATTAVFGLDGENEPSHRLEKMNAQLMRKLASHRRHSRRRPRAVGHEPGATTHAPKLQTEPGIFVHRHIDQATMLVPSCLIRRALSPRATALAIYRQFGGMNVTRFCKFSLLLL